MTKIQKEGTYYSLAALLFLFISFCKENRQIEINITKPEGLPKFARQITGFGDWIYLDNETGYFIRWDDVGTPIVEVFLVENLTKRIIKSYTGLGSEVRQILTYSLLNKKEIPEDVYALSLSEDPYFRKRQDTEISFSTKISMDPTIMTQIFPRTYFGVTMWNSGPNYVFNNGKKFSIACSRRIGETLPPKVEGCGVKKYLHTNGRIEEIRYLKSCDHECSTIVYALKPGYYRINTPSEVNLRKYPHDNSVALDRLTKHHIIEILANPIEIESITHAQFLWIRVKVNSTIGYLKKSEINNRPVNYSEIR
ncbi:hypothetical protein AB3N61_18325 [Leptospira sp. WS58.C1]|uniref:hypothetical protein n=1 Tax=Leptospira cinconiae TaxID=3235173 RepID=UPI00349E9303